MYRLDIVNKVYFTITVFDLIRPGETVVCGVSGGPDSIAMLSILRKINSNFNLDWKIYVAHLNHGIRAKEADKDQEFVEQISKKWGLICYSKKIDIKSVRKKKKSGIEETGRTERLNFFREIAQTVGAQKIATAHTLNDQAETILHRIIRGTGIKGLRGILPIRRLSRHPELFIVRPMIQVERDEIIKYLEEENIKYCQDRTNLDTKFTRNKIRHDLIPKLQKEYNPKVTYALIRLGYTAMPYYTLVKEIAKEVFENVKMISAENEVCLNSSEFAKQPVAIQTLIVELALTKLMGKPPNLLFEHYLRIISLSLERVEGKSIQLPKNIIVTKDAYLLRFTKKIPSAPVLLKKRIKINIKGTTYIDPLKIKILSNVIPMDNSILNEIKSNKKSTEEFLDFDKLSLPLYLRTRKKADVFFPLGSPGTQKLKKFFIDQKVPKHLRDRIPIVTDGRKIIWVVGYRISEEVKIDPSTKRVLKIQVERAPDNE